MNTHSPKIVNSMKIYPPKYSANKRQVKHFSGSLKRSITLHSLAIMIDSENINLERIKTLKKRSLQSNFLRSTLQKDASKEENLLESPQLHAVDPNNKYNLNFFSIYIALSAVSALS